MGARTSSVVLLAALVGSAPAGAKPPPLIIPPRVAPGPLSSFTVDGPVSAVAEAGGKVYLGGSFVHAGPVTGAGVFLDRVSGLAATPVARVEGQVFAAIDDGAGGAYIAGSFGAVGQQTRLNLAHLLPDGSLDPGFTANADGPVTAIVLTGGKLYAGGDFGHVGGFAHAHLVALDPASGAVDPDFTASADAKVSHLATDGTKLFVGGTFRGLDGHSRNALGAVDLQTGQLDAGFDLSFDGEIDALAVRADRLYVGGQFGQLGGRTRTNLAALSTDDGTIDPGFSPATDGKVNTIVPDGDRLLVGGEFGLIAGQLHRAVASLDPATGDADPNFTVAADGDVFTIGVAPERLYLGGDFNTIAGQARHRVAAVDAFTGNLDGGFDPDPSDDVYTALVQGDRLYIGGKFLSAPRVRRGNLAAVDAATGILDPTFAPTADGAVITMAVHDGKLYAGGDFRAIDGHGHPGLAALALTTGAPDPDFAANVNSVEGPRVSSLAFAGERLYVGGGFTSVAKRKHPPYVVFNARTGVEEPLTLHVPGRKAEVDTDGVSAVAVDGNRLLLGGVDATRLVVRKHRRKGESRYAREALVANLAAFDRTSGQLVRSFTPHIQGNVHALLPLGNRLLVGGSLRRRVGTILVKPRMGKRPAVFKPAYRDNLLAVGRQDGSRVLGFRPEPDGAVDALMVNGQRLLAGGSFSDAGNTRTCGLAAMAPETGAVDPSYAPLPEGRVAALTQTPGRVWVGGGFSGFGFGVQVFFAALPDMATAPPPGTPTNPDAARQVNCDPDGDD